MLRELGLGRSPQITGILNDLALSRMFQGDYQEASALMHEVLAIDSSLYGSSHPYLASHLENMAMIYDYRGFADSNVMVLNQTLAMRRAVLPDDSPDIGRTLFNLGTAEYLRGNYEAAEPLYEESLARMRRAYGPLHPDIVWATASPGPEPVPARPAGPKRSGTCAGRSASPIRMAGSTRGPSPGSGRSWWRFTWSSGAGRRLSRWRCGCWRFGTAWRIRWRAKSAAQLAQIYRGKGRPDLAAEYLKRALPP